MRVSSISSYSSRVNNYSNLKRKDQRVQRNNQNEFQKTYSTNPNFKGCHVFKIAGFLAGAAAVTILAPQIAIMGLAGLGAGPGALLGTYLDEKIDSKDK